MATDEDWRILEDEEGSQIEEYDLTASPNDFNVTTIFAFIESGAVQIPGFQRNYVWDIKRASRLIESLIIGLPVPQVFLYEEDRNRFLVIDGQQRLMTIYYFVRQRFPRRERRAEIRRIFDEERRIPDEILHSDDYFEPFNLRLPEVQPGTRNRFHRMNYLTLSDYKMQFDLRTIRNMIVKQIRPSDDTSSIYEMFNRLNTGGVNLTPQEIRSSLFHSAFYDCLFKWNMDDRWRSLLGRHEPDLHMRDIEVLLRGLSMWQMSDDYAPSMVKFLNRYSKRAQGYSDSERGLIYEKFDWFLSEVEGVDRDVWLTRGKFQVTLFESVFAAACKLHDDRRPLAVDDTTIRRLREDTDFQNYSLAQTTHTENVKRRIQLAKRLLST